MKIKNKLVVYFFTKGGNTSRFVEKILSHLEFRNLNIEVWQIISKDLNPHRDLEELQLFRRISDGNEILSSAPYEETKLNVRFLVVTPSYGEFCRKLGKTSNFTPKPVLEVLEDLPEDLTSVIRLGNRTFGSHFAVVSPAVQRYRNLGEYELAGTQWDAEEVARKVLNQYEQL